MTTVSAADMLGNDVIREEILQKLRENAARLQQEGTTLPPQASQDLISISDEARRRLEEQKAADDGADRTAAAGESDCADRRRTAASVG